MKKSNHVVVFFGFFLIIFLCISTVQADKVVPLCPAGTAFDASRYAQNTPQSDPMVFTCYWDGTGTVYISGNRSSLTGIYADDGYTITIQPSGAEIDSAEHWAHQHPVIDLTSGMRPGLNTITLVVHNWQGLSMSYGSITGTGTDQEPYIVRVDPTHAIPLCPAGTAFNASRYAQNTPQSDPMVFPCYWDGTGTVYMSGERSYLAGIYADDGYTITIQPSGAAFDAAEHWAHQHPVIDLTSGMRPGLNTITLVVHNWKGLSMSYGSINGTGTDQTPYIVQVDPAPVPIPEFPSAFLPVTMIIMVSGILLLIRRTREH
jgi:hypothetical protein